MDDTLAAIQTKYAKLPLGHLPLGCSEDQVKALMADQEVTYLPPLYVELLKLMGRRGLGDVLDCDAILEHLLHSEIKSEIQQSCLLPDDIFVFAHHHGYIFYFFRTKDCHIDPTTYVLRNETIHKGSDSLAQFIKVEAYLVPPMEREAHYKTVLATEYHYSPDLDDFVVTA